mmetsp:Transcript_127306/g.407215  ORF Transcript_127306/g.407215 Transcript_127306/m.407215 type:complete len:462 (+) Transcript_127306:75-1460(+)
MEVAMAPARDAASLSVGGLQAEDHGLIDRPADLAGGVVDTAPCEIDVTPASSSRALASEELGSVELGPTSEQASQSAELDSAKLRSAVEDAQEPRQEDAELGSVEFGAVLQDVQEPRQEAAEMGSSAACEFADRQEDAELGSAELGTVLQDVQEPRQEAAEMGGPAASELAELAVEEVGLSLPPLPPPETSPPTSPLAVLPLAVVAASTVVAASPEPDDTVEAVQRAVVALSSTTAELDEDTWKVAASWALRPVSPEAAISYLQALGFKVESDEQWQQPPQESGSMLEFRLDGHARHAEHTWYGIECFIHSSNEHGSSSTQWNAPRRLTQLRMDLHDPIKDSLVDAYPALFGNAPFAKMGGPPGTSSRLRAWLTALAGAFNRGLLSPRVAALVLLFMQAPVLSEDPSTAGASAPGSPVADLRGFGESALRQENADVDSQWGGSEAYSQGPSAPASTITSPR